MARILLAKPSPDFLFNLGELFTLVVYGQLILENARLLDIDGTSIRSSRG